MAYFDVLHTFFLVNSAKKDFKIREFGSNFVFKIVRLFRSIFQLLTWHWHICCHCDRPFSRSVMKSSTHSFFIRSWSSTHTSHLHHVAVTSRGPRVTPRSAGVYNPYSEAHTNPGGLVGPDWNTSNGRFSRCMRPHQMPEHITSHQLYVFHGCNARSVHMSSSCEELPSKNYPSFPWKAFPVQAQNHWLRRPMELHLQQKAREAILKPLNYEPWRNTTPTEKTLKWQTKLSLW